MMLHSSNKLCLIEIQIALDFIIRFPQFLVLVFDPLNFLFLIVNNFHNQLLVTLLLKFDLLIHLLNVLHLHLGLFKLEMILLLNSCVFQVHSFLDSNTFIFKMFVFSL